MGPKDEATLEYAVDLGTEVSIAQNSTRLPIKRVKIESGEMRTYCDRKQRTIYTIMNNRKKKLNIFLDHNFLEAWQLVESEQPVDITDRYYRFK